MEKRKVLRKYFILVSWKNFEFLFDFQILPLYFKDWGT